MTATCIDPSGVVHIAGRLLNEVDGPMLTTGLQGFHGKPIAVLRRPIDRPDPARLQTRIDLSVAAALARPSIGSAREDGSPIS